MEARPGWEQAGGRPCSDVSCRWDERRRGGRLGGSGPGRTEIKKERVLLPDLDRPPETRQPSHLAPFRPRPPPLPPPTVPPGFILVSLFAGWSSAAATAPCTLWSPDLDAGTHPLRPPLLLAGSCSLSCSAGLGAFPPLPASERQQGPLRPARCSVLVLTLAASATFLLPCSPTPRPSAPPRPRGHLALFDPAAAVLSHSPVPVPSLGRLPSLGSSTDPP